MILRMGNGARVDAEALGLVTLACNNQKLELNDCLYTPSLLKNIISIPVLDKENYEFSCKNGKCFLSKDGSLIATGTLSNGLYTLDSNFTLLQIQQRNKRKLDDHAYLLHA